MRLHFSVLDPSEVEGRGLAEVLTTATQKHKAIWPQAKTETGPGFITEPVAEDTLEAFMDANTDRFLAESAVVPVVSPEHVQYSQRIVEVRVNERELVLLHRGEKTPWQVINDATELVGPTAVDAVVDAFPDMEEPVLTRIPGQLVIRYAAEQEGLVFGEFDTLEEAESDAAVMASMDPHVTRAVVRPRVEFVGEDGQVQPDMFTAICHPPADAKVDVAVTTAVPAPGAPVDRYVVFFAANQPR